MTPNAFKHSLSFSIIFLISFSFTSAQNFEGKITIQNTIPNTLNAVFTFKDEIAMMESKNERGNMKMINNKKTGEKITITENEGRTIIVLKNSNDMQYRKLNKKYSKRKLPRTNSSVKVTRETKKINGYKCYKVVGSDSKFEGEAWITQKFEMDPSTFFPITRLGQRALPRIAKALQNSMEGFVMEMTIKNIKTKKVDKMSVKIDIEDIDVTAFEVDMDGLEVYDEETVREMMKAAKNNPDKMKKARTLLAQIRMQ